MITEAEPAKTAEAAPRFFTSRFIGEYTMGVLQKLLQSATGLSRAMGAVRSLESLGEETFDLWTALARHIVKAQRRAEGILEEADLKDYLGVEREGKFGLVAKPGYMFQQEDMYETDTTGKSRKTGVVIRIGHEPPLQ